MIIRFTLNTLLVALLMIAYHGNAQNCFSALGTGIGNHAYNYNTQYYDNGVYALTSYNGNLVAGGVFDSAGLVEAHGIAMWDGTAWSPVGVGLSNNYAQGNIIYCMTVFNGDLYVGGVFDSIGGIAANSIARWDGSAWHAMGAGVSGTYPSYVEVYSMTVYNGALYVAGQFDKAGNLLVNSVAKWDGLSWYTVGAGIVNTGFSLQQYVLTLTVNNGLLCAGGTFQSASGVAVNNVAAWNGTNWSALGNGLGSTDNQPEVASLTSSNGNLYASVIYADSAGYPQYYTSAWNGNNWANVAGGPGSGVIYKGSLVSLLPYNGTLFGAGEFNVTPNDTSYGWSGIAQLNGNTWHKVAGIQGGSGEFLSMGMANSNLFVGGEFNVIGSTPAMNVAEYTCATAIDNLASASVKLYPNPNRGSFNLSNTAEVSGGEIQIYNMLGQLVYQSAIDYGNSTIHITQSVAGTFLYRIVNVEGTVVSSGKFIVE